MIFSFEKYKRLVFLIVYHLDDWLDYQILTQYANASDKFEIGLN